LGLDGVGGYLSSPELDGEESYAEIWIFMQFLEGCRQVDL